MAQIRDAETTRRIINLLQEGSFNTSDIVNEINKALPPAQQIKEGSLLTTGIFKEFGTYDKINAKREIVTTGMWSGGVGNLSGSMYTHSEQTTSLSGNYYYNVYNSADTGSAELQFSIAYGNINGGGSLSFASASSEELLSGEVTLPSTAIYSQFRSILLPPGQEKFQFENGSGVLEEVDHIFAITIARDRYVEQMDAGNWELEIDGTTYIDDSGKKFGDHLGKEGKVFKVVQGDLNLGTQEDAEIISVTGSNDSGIGLFYPDKGIIILNPDELGTTISTSLDLDMDSEKKNHQYLFNNIDAFIARRTENISTQHFFVRATNREFNYSNNPTYITNGRFTNHLFEADPKTYMTTIGLYNGSNELVAVAKTSQPIEKSYEKEVLIKIKLSY
jgi:hypothetical protein